MRRAQLRPEITPWKANQVLRASTWKSRDRLTTLRPRRHIRDVYHYDHRMLTYTYNPTLNRWEATYASVGIGSVSDQQGMTLLGGCRYDRGQLLHDYGVRYTRSARLGGPRVWIEAT